MGREGAEHYNKRLQQKAMAKRLAVADESGLTAKDAQKIINEATDIQKKADASRAAVFAKPKPSYQRSASKYARSNNRTNKPNVRRSSYPSKRNSRGPARSNPRPRTGGKPHKPHSSNA